MRGSFNPSRALIPSDRLPERNPDVPTGRFQRTHVANGEVKPLCLAGILLYFMGDAGGKGVILDRGACRYQLLTLRGSLSCRGLVGSVGEVAGWMDKERCVDFGYGSGLRIMASPVKSEVI